MAIEFQCPSCCRDFRVRDSFGGTRWACPSCGAAMDVPGPGAARPAEHLDWPDPVQKWAGRSHWFSDFKPSPAPKAHYRMHDKAEFDHPTINTGGGEHHATKGLGEAGEYGRGWYERSLAQWNRNQKRREERR